MEEKYIQSFDGEPEGKRLRENKTMFGLEYNVTLEEKELIWECMDWIIVTQDTYKWRLLLDSEMNLPVPKNTDYLTIWKTISFLRRNLLLEVNWLGVDDVLDAFLHHMCCEIKEHSENQVPKTTIETVCI